MKVDWSAGKTWQVFESATTTRPAPESQAVQDANSRFTIRNEDAAMLLASSIAEQILKTPQRAKRVHTLDFHTSQHLLFSIA